MKKITAHLIEDLSNQLNLEGNKITIVLRSREDEIKDRPNALVLTRGKKGWTRCIQTPYYSVCGSEYYREYTDEELNNIIDTIKHKGVFSKSQYGGWYQVNK